MNKLHKIRTFGICAVLVALPFLFLRSSLKAPAEANVVDRFVITISAPVQSGFEWIYSTIDSAVSSYIALVGVAEDNQLLRSRNQELRTRVRQLDYVYKENRELKELLGLRQELALRSVAAHVIAKDISPAFRVLRLQVEHFSSRTIEPGMPVVSTDGLVGEVRRVVGKYVDVSLVADEQSRIDTVVRRTGARGRLEGTGRLERYESHVQFDERSDEVNVGDILITSGLGKKYPAGIPVGRVTTLEPDREGLLLRGTVEPTVVFLRLERVLIVVGRVDEPEGVPYSGTEEGANTK
ncbi:MAG: rod shape-determining protein MreC [Polyangiales bacterium]